MPLEGVGDHIQVEHAYWPCYSFMVSFHTGAPVSTSGSESCLITGWTGAYIEAFTTLRGAQCYDSATEGVEGVLAARRRTFSKA